MRPQLTATLLAIVMGCTSVGAYVARPAPRSAEQGPTISLEAIVPKSFGEWLLVPDGGAQVVNPQVEQLLDKIYSQILTRTYVNKEGYRIMLSIAYGNDQRGGLQTHRPEVCYPGQGFAITGQQDGTLTTDHGAIEVRRLQTNLGQRKEPVTYWLTVGDRVVNRQIDKRIAEIRLALTGEIPDGLLFRVSSIDADSRRAFERQQLFTAQMMSAVPPEARKRLSGLVSQSNAG